MKPLTIYSWNVNSINARIENILLFIEQNNPDIILLQEIKCQQINEELFANYNIYFYGQKTYNGVAILSKIPLEDVKNIDFEGAIGEARYIEGVLILDNKAITLASIYVPNGQTVGSVKYYDKLRFLNHIKNHFHTIECLIVGGDFNVAPTPIDVYQQNDMGLACTELERIAIYELYNIGLIDSLRYFYPNEILFSWWDYRNKYAFAHNHGMRIDYILTKGIIPKSAHILHDIRGWHKPSDHCPVKITV